MSETRTATKCTECGTAGDPTHRFCTACGAALADPAAQSTVAPTGESRLEIEGGGLKVAQLAVVGVATALGVGWFLSYGSILVWSDADLPLRVLVAYGPFTLLVLLAWTGPPRSATQRTLTYWQAALIGVASASLTSVTFGKEVVYSYPRAFYDAPVLGSLLEDWWTVTTILGWAFLAAALIAALVRWIAAAPHGDRAVARTGEAAGPTNGFAIASLVLGLLGIALLGLIFGLIALSQIKRSGGKQLGRGLAVSGVVLSVLWMSVSVAVLIALASASGR